MRIRYKSWDANGKCYSYRIGALVFMARWVMLWFVLDWSPVESNKEIVIVNFGPFLGNSKKYKRVWFFKSLNVNRALKFKAAWPFAFWDSK